MVKISSIFVAFLENMNFTKCDLLYKWCKLLSQLKVFLKKSEESDFKPYAD